MKQSQVTRKNRKVRLLRELYPHVNIQVFYQKDFENLIFKYGLAGAAGAGMSARAASGSGARALHRGADRRRAFAKWRPRSRAITRARR